jgi:hypothetical protein
VLKKAGIIVTASVAGLLAVAPLAFAAPGHDKPPKTAGETAEPPAGPAEPTAGGTTIEFTDNHSCTTGGANAMTGLVSLVPIAVNVPLLNCNEVNFGNQSGNNS